jgi:NNP family nitrate/nitrite transporter-like MFS transporter
MPLIEDEFLIGHAKASSLFAFNNLGYGISLFFSGIFAGFLGYKRSIVLSMITSTCLFFCIPYVKLFSLLSFFSFILGMSAGVYLPSIIPLITEYFEEKSWGKAIAIHDSAASISIFSAPFIALFLLKFLKWREIFDVFGVVCMVCIIVFWLTCNELKIKKVKGDLFRGIMKRRSLWVMGIIWVFSTGACLGVYFVVPLYLTKELSFDIAYANKIFGISRIGGVFVAIMAGFIVDKFSVKKTMFYMILATGVLTLLMTYRDVRFIEVFLFLQASVSTGFFPVGLVTISRMFEKEYRGMATGFIVTLGVVFGLGVLPYLLGLAGDHLSFRFGIFLFGILVILSSGLIYFLKELK